MSFKDEAGVRMCQVESEFRTLLEIYRSLRPKYVLEIGSYKGGTLYHFLKNAAPGAHVISIDALPEVWEEDGVRYDKNDWKQWAPEGVELHIINGRSEDQDVIDLVNEICPWLDFLFIDGRHTYPAVKADYDNYSPFIRDGGIVALHDILDNPAAPNNRVSQLFKEIKISGRKTKTIIASPHQKKFGIGVIYY